MTPTDPCLAESTSSPLLQALPSPFHSFADNELEELGSPPRTRFSSAHAAINALSPTARCGLSQKTAHPSSLVSAYRGGMSKDCFGLTGSRVALQACGKQPPHGTTLTHDDGRAARLHAAPQVPCCPRLQQQSNRWVLIMQQFLSLCNAGVMALRQRPAGFPSSLPHRWVPAPSLRGLCFRRTSSVAPATRPSRSFWRLQAARGVCGAHRWGRMNSCLLGLHPAA